jgi:steroid 5-alpha reductase family enzyme
MLAEAISTLLIVAIAASALGLLFAATFGAARRMDNYGVVDITWSYAFSVLALFYAVVTQGWATRRWVMAAMVALWSIRLGTHLCLRLRGHHPVEDSRYIEMRSRWGEEFAAKMFVFYQQQAASVRSAFPADRTQPVPNVSPARIRGYRTVAPGAFRRIARRLPTSPFQEKPRQ